MIGENLMMIRKYNNLMMNRKLFVILVFMAYLPAAASAQIASGGSFELERSAVATGGGTSANGAFSIAGTSGQATAGTNSTNEPFAQASGFWIPGALMPTASLVSVGGRVVTAEGSGIRNVTVTLTDSAGRTRTARTKTFGHYRFTDVTAGETYILSVRAKRYFFANPTQVVSVLDELTDVNFEADAR